MGEHETLEYLLTSPNLGTQGTIPFEMEKGTFCVKKLNFLRQTGNSSSHIERALNNWILKKLWIMACFQIKTALHQYTK